MGGHEVLLEKGVGQDMPFLHEYNKKEDIGKTRKINGKGTKHALMSVTDDRMDVRSKQR